MSGEPSTGKADAWSAISAPADVARAAQRLATYGNSPPELAARERFLERLDLAAGQRVLVALDLEPCEGGALVRLDARRGTSADGSGARRLQLSPEDSIQRMSPRSEAQEVSTS